MNDSPHRPEYSLHHVLHFAWKTLLWRFSVAILLLFSFVSQTWSQLSAGAPDEAPKLTPLPHPEIAKTVMLESGVSPWIIVLAVFGLLALATLFIWLLFRKKIAVPPISPPPLKYALERLEKLRSQVDQIPPSEAAHQVSLILRDYQMGRYSLPAPYRTSEELYGVKSLVHREEMQQRFAPISAIYDRLEFAPLATTKADILSLIESAIQALHEEKRYQSPHYKITKPSPPLSMEPTA